MSTTPPLAVIESGIPNAKSRRRGERTTRIRGTRPGPWVYITLGVVFISAAFPLYWSFIIGSGDASSTTMTSNWSCGVFSCTLFRHVNVSMGLP